MPRFGTIRRWHKYSWLAEFVSQIPHYRGNTIATVRLALEARRHLFAIAEREGIDFDLERRGILHIYRDRQSFDHASQVNSLLQRGGLERHAVSPEEMKTIEPTIHGQFYGGFFTPSDSTGDIHKFTRQLATVCERRGMRLQCDVSVDRIVADRDGITLKWRASADERAAVAVEETGADAVVICAGVASRRFAASLGDRLNIYPVKGYSITVELDDAASRAGAPGRRKSPVARLAAHRRSISPISRGSAHDYCLSLNFSPPHATPPLITGD